MKSGDGNGEGDLHRVRPHTGVKKEDDRDVDLDATMDNFSDDDIDDMLKNFDRRAFKSVEANLANI